MLFCPCNKTFHKVVSRNLFHRDQTPVHKLGAAGILACSYAYCRMYKDSGCFGSAAPRTVGTTCPQTCSSTQSYKPHPRFSTSTIPSRVLLGYVARSHDPSLRED